MQKIEDPLECLIRIAANEPRAERHDTDDEHENQIRTSGQRSSAGVWHRVVTAIRGAPRSIYLSFAGDPGPLRWVVRHDDRAGGGEHAAYAVADRDLGAGNLSRGDAAHLAHALLQGVHAVHAGVHVGETTAVCV